MDISLEKNKADGRLVWLDFGKAIGILMVLIVHAECRLGFVTYYGGMFYMPVFFVAAGYTYRCRKEESYGIFLKKKAKRLLVPYFGTSAFLWLFFWVKDSVLGGKLTDFKLPSVFGILYSRNQMYTVYAGGNPVLMDLLNAPLWFLTAMFLTYAYYESVNRTGRKNLMLAAGLLASVLWHWSTPLLLPWSLDAVPYFACFLAVGEELRERDGIYFLMEKWYRNLPVLVLFVCLSLLNGSVNLSLGCYGYSMLLYLAAGSLGSVLVLSAGAALERVYEPAVRALGRIGQETLTILCFHMFLFMFIRTAAGLLGIGAGAAQAALVIGSAVLLTAAGRIRHGRQSVRKEK